MCALKTRKEKENPRYKKERERQMGRKKKRSMVERHGREKER